MGFFISSSMFVLVMITVIGGALGAALVGKMIGFYPIEAAITGGLCMANMGGPAMWRCSRRPS